MSGNRYNSQEEHAVHCDGKEFTVSTGETAGVRVGGEGGLSIVRFYDPDIRGNLGEACCDECLASVNLAKMTLK